MFKLKYFRYYLGKVLLVAFSILCLSVIVFFISRLTPNDPLQSYYGSRVEKMSPMEKERSRERLGLNDPIYVQYQRWIGLVMQGDFGMSYKYKRPAGEVISKRLTNTLVLGGTGFAFVFVFALLLGVVCAWNENSWLDKLICRCGTITTCIPEFWLALVLILVFCIINPWLPSSGAYTIGRDDFIDRLKHLILPLAVVILGHLWYYAYMVRNKILEEVVRDYVLLCKAKGLSKSKIIFIHCLRNILPAYISIMAVSVAHIVGGTYIVETVFSYPGIGTLAYESARYADYNLLMILCMFTGILVILCNAVGEIINERLDSRIKLNVSIVDDEMVILDEEQGEDNGSK